ncbi:ABC transporter ATP-binding protein [Phreatobacter aquaticus]|uniref:ABC transporter ATP-binding protein n=1 Tax=Phreatobacter aquaticus TaxID=2570229 RepID=A0A4D7QM08_9HYPH|nr:ABC transporter ATP-binding protein [Phreatobacter aquaticus]QCK88265.1 ABC transporter ATP-binding protein [Phreatobacter aquaticus]
MRLLNLLLKTDPQRGETLKRLVAESIREYAARYVLAFICMAVVALCTAFSAWVMRDLINGVFQNRDFTLAVWFGVTVFSVFLIKGVAAYFANVILSRIGNAIVAAQQTRIFRHLLAQGVDFYHQHASADLVTRVTHNAQAARDVLQNIVTTVGRDLLTVAGLIVVMLISDPLMFMVSGLVMPFAVYGVNQLRRRVRRLAQSEFTSLSSMVGVVQETVQGVRIVKAFGLEDRMQDRMDATIDAVRQRADKIATLGARTAPLMETLGGLAISAAIVYGAWRVIHQGVDAGAFFAFVTALLLAYDPAKRLARLGVEVEKGLVGVRLMYELLDTEPTLTEKPDAASLKMAAGTVAFEGVTFSYRGDEPVLRDMSFVATGGKMTALVGPSGGGKSTVIALVQRFFDVGSGRVTVDGQDVRDVTFASLRGEMAFVSQDVFLFQGSVRENIAVGRPGASEEDIVAAARAAYAHDFILGLPEGYQTLVGEHGQGLSGGQRQRVAIARAILKNAPIMLLDEATSALDSESEFEVQRALDELMTGRTSIVIAHRLSTVMRADKILVVEAGRVVETGTHAELIARNGLYAHYVSIQFGDRSDAAE